MDYPGRAAMREIVDLNHGDLKEFAIAVKMKVYMNTPSEADFIDAIYEAAKTLAVDPEKDDEPPE